MHKGTSLLLVAFAILSADVARADSLQAKERLAHTACLSGEPAKGVALLAELFVDTKNATYIYNQGRCFEQNGRWEDAISRFEEYLRVGKELGKNEEAEAQKHIVECQARVAKQNSQKPALVVPAAPALVTEPAPTASPPVPSPPPPTPVGLDLSAPVAPGESTDAPFYKTWWFWTGAGVVAAGAVTAGLLLADKGGSNVPQTSLGHYVGLP